MYSAAAIAAGVGGGINLEYNGNGLELWTANPVPPAVDQTSEREGDVEGQQEGSDATSAVEAQRGGESES